MDHLLFKSPILKFHLEKMEAWIASSSAKYLDLPLGLVLLKRARDFGSRIGKGVTIEG